ncbi:hypothetical protein [Cohnella sp.]
MERGTFQWPQACGEPLTISNRELRWLLDGMSLTQRHAIALLSFLSRCAS